MQLCPQVDDNEPIVIGSISDEWQFFLEAWKHIPIKYYSLQVGSGITTNRRLLYINPKREGVSYQIKTNMPHIISIKNNSLILSKDEGMYVKFTITPPTTPCKINIKFVIEDIITQLPVEGIEMEINVKNT
ncbi:unnamed protein product [Paramecium primaurelia]|uniref:NPHP4 Ig-like domain-containing protein n=1 Tax=Paramecium primaurelia TaxID=5886 RepID=A0A8S1K025_PARPR|nr:unnamed protein product [Paramecium primaurelia]